MQDNIDADVPITPVEKKKAEKVEKKKPGRPRKTAPVAAPETHGIIEAPGMGNILMELVYCNPGMFKKLLNLYKQFSVSEIDMRFDKLGLKIITKDHLGKSDIYATIEGSCMNSYFCKVDIEICVRRDSLESAFKTLGKNHQKITMTLGENYRAKLLMSFTDTEYNNVNSYEFDVMHKENAAAAPVAHDDKEYPIKFKMSSKHLKVLVASISALSDVIILTKAGAESLQFSSVKGQKVTLTSIYPDFDKIELVNKLAADDIFAVSINIDYITPFSNSPIGDDVFIAAHGTEPLSMMTCMDKKGNTYACRVKIFTQIK